MATKCDSRKEVAVDLVVAGRSLTDVARAIDISRQTVSWWLHHDPSFQTLLAQRRQEVYGAALDRLRSTVLPKAIATVEAALDAGGPDALRAALKLISLAATAQPSGETKATKPVPSSGWEKPVPSSGWDDSADRG